MGFSLRLIMFNTPILFLVFNRPDTTIRVFEQIRKIKPAFLYVAADGPRKDKLGEKEICNRVREIVSSNIDWECEVKTLFRDENLGCGKAVSDGITWFFEQEEEGIILEDDCLPDVSFFQFCTELLEKYRTDEKVMTISGSNLLGYPWKVTGQSYFWGQGGIWGWATWKRAWRLYDFKMQTWEEDKVKSQIRNALKTEEWYQFYLPMFVAVFDKTLDTWDIQWLYTILINEGLSINPEVNLVKNIGFGNNSTHTENIKNPLADLSNETILFPLKHPEHRNVDLEQLNLMYKAIQPPKKLRLNIFNRVINSFR
jgi:hypothetical protein